MNHVCKWYITNAFKGNRTRNIASFFYWKQIQVIASRMDLAKCMVRQDAFCMIDSGLCRGWASYRFEWYSMQQRSSNKPYSSQHTCLLIEFEVPAAFVKLTFSLRPPILNVLFANNNTILLSTSDVTPVLYKPCFPFKLCLLSPKRDLHICLCLWCSNYLISIQCHHMQLHPCEIPIYLSSNHNESIYTLLSQIVSKNQGLV